MRNNRKNTYHFDGRVMNEAEFAEYAASLLREVDPEKIRLLEKLANLKEYYEQKLRYLDMWNDLYKDRRSELRPIIVDWRKEREERKMKKAHKPQSD